MTRRRILVTSAGGPGAVNLTRSLLAMTPCPFVACVEASPYYAFLALGHVRALVPRTRDREAFLDALNRLVDTHAIDFVMPNGSIEIAALSEARDRLQARVFLPDPATLALADSKWASHEIWRDAGLPVPETHLIDAPATLRAVFPRLQREPDAPVWVRGAGIPGKGIGVASLPCRTVDQAIHWVDYWNGWGGMIASEFLPGDNLTWMGLFDAGRLVTSQGRRRLAYVIPHVSPSGITGAPAISHTVHDPELNRIGEAAALALDRAFTGVCFVDLKGDADGRPRITELNAGRFGTTHYFYTAAGANFPAMLLATAYGEPLDVPRQDILPPDLYWIRTLDAGPVLTTREAIDAGRYPVFDPDAPGQWPLVPQDLHDYPISRDPLWR